MLRSLNVIASIIAIMAVISTLTVLPLVTKANRAVLTVIDIDDDGLDENRSGEDEALGGAIVSCLTAAIKALMAGTSARDEHYYAA